MSAAVRPHGFISRVPQCRQRLPICALPFAMTMVSGVAPCQPCAALVRRCYSSSQPLFSPLSPPNSKFSGVSRGKRRRRIRWYYIPVMLGVLTLGSMQLYKISTREEREELKELGPQAPRRQKIIPQGPWQVQMMALLPLKAVSRVWRWFNELRIPVPLREPGFRLYAWLFNVNLHEAAETDLRNYENLAEFFYRRLKPGCRPLDPNPDALLSPADGRVLQFGRVNEGQVEQVKGITFPVDALLGSQSQTISTPPSRRNSMSSSSGSVTSDDEEFALMNGISYTLPEFMSGQQQGKQKQQQGWWRKLGLGVRQGQQPQTAATDESMPHSESAEREVGAELIQGEKPWYDRVVAGGRQLYYAVVYLAPGDYHRFHSPTAWVVERRRHFAGELYSVSPYLVRMLPGLFTINERVVLLGRWRYGFFSYVPVGATNVGSIRVNFDRELRTNSLLTDTAADKAAAETAERGEPYTGFSEASYEAASSVLGGYALRRGEEMGGFRLGSTIVLVFEAPAGAQQSWKWAVEKGQTVQVGQALGYVVDQSKRS